jgi:hypothetical protein
MEEMSIPYHNAVSIGDENLAAQIIARAGNLNRDVCHIATKQRLCNDMSAMGELILLGCRLFIILQIILPRHIHPYTVRLAHCMTMLCYQFIDAPHRALAPPMDSDSSLL